jgi:hypothetical protein
LEGGNETEKNNIAADAHSAAEPQPKKTTNSEQTEEAEVWKETGGTRLEMRNKGKRKTQARGQARGVAKRGQRKSGFKFFAARHESEC